VPYLERLKVFTTRRYTNPRLPLPLPLDYMMTGKNKHIPKCSVFISSKSSILNLIKVKYSLHYTGETITAIHSCVMPSEITCAHTYKSLSR